MLDILLWVIVIALFIASFVGLIFPVIPSSLLIWIGFILYHFVLHPDALGTTFWIAMVVLTVLLIVADIIANSYFVKRFGGSKWGELGAAIGVILGSFIIPPFGIVIIPFGAVLVIEIIQKKTFQEAIRAGIGSLFGFFGGTIAKIMVQLIMIIWFFIAILF